ncbi:zinc ribbon domain-containing protein [Bacillus timonensis]|uniref:zinc ribbon domain-containing protein n=1 Tax=Bacillus timonensis TaxID=1033734 RepID=UPI00028A14D8|nr:zinc ribbon domain-containing protein [Bacillus timonensis]
MRFCTSCGAKKIDDTPFCNECGAKFEDVKVPQAKKAVNTPGISALSLKSKIIIGAVLAILILGFGLYKLGESMTDRTKLLASFTENLDKGDVKELVKMLDTPDESLEVTDQHVKELVEYLEEDPYLKEELIAQLTANSKAGGFKLDPAEMEQYGMPQLITFEKRGKHFFLYDNYDFVLQTFPLKVNTNYDDLTFFIDGKEVESKVLEEGYISLGDMLPGDYEIKAVLSSDFVELEKEVKVGHFSSSSIDMYLDIDYARIQSNVDGAKVLVNDKDTGIKVTGDEEVEIGPVLLDGSMTVKIEQETPFGKMQSSAVPIDSDYLTVNLSLTKEEKEKVTNQLVTFLTSVSKSRVNGDKDLVEGHTDYLQKELIDPVDDQYWSYSGYLSDIRVNEDSYYLGKEDGKWIAGVEGIETWKEHNYKDYSGTIESEDISNSFSYEFVYDEKEKKWAVNYYDNISDVDESKLAKVKFDVAAQQKLFEASPVFKEVKTEMNQDGIAPFVENFVYTSIDAINNREFSYVSGLIDPSSSDYLKETSNYIDYLEEKDITEDLLDIEIVDIKEKSDTTFTVSTHEKYHIYYSDGTAKYKAYNSKYDVRSTPDGFRMYKLIDTKEVDSEDL